MRAWLFVLTLLATATLIKADAITVGPRPLGDRSLKGLDAIYTLPEPDIPVGQKITNFGLNLSVTSSATGYNKQIPDPYVEGVLEPNPLLPPPPPGTPPVDCKNPKADCVMVPITLNGVDPNERKKALVTQFSFNQANSSATQGKSMNIAGDGKTAPKKYTQRADQISLAWDATGNVNFFPYKTKINGVQKTVDALTFGAILNSQQSIFSAMGTGQERYVKSTQSFLSCSWGLGNGGTVSCPKTPLTVAMGQNNFSDGNGNLLAALGFSYTNDGSNTVDLSDVVFDTSATRIPLDELGLAGTLLSNPQVTLNGNPEPVQSDYDVPAGYTIQFFFPDTTDLFFTAVGDISSDGVFQLGFGYEDQIANSPEPEPFLLLAGGLAGIAMLRRRDARPTTGLLLRGAVCKILRAAS